MAKKYGKMQSPESLLLSFIPLPSLFRPFETGWTAGVVPV
jgi:hypothetical protein